MHVKIYTLNYDIIVCNEKIDTIKNLSVLTTGWRVLTRNSKPGKPDRCTHAMLEYTGGITGYYVPHR